jgi:WD40 repeat protein/DNA-binding SARP family transcriptional activator
VLQPIGVPDGNVQAYGRPMRFGVLGPLEVSVEDGQIPLGGRKQLSVLAGLLLHPNRVVPAEDLIDQVWGEDPPNTARKTLQGYVTHLRRALGPDRLEWRAPGYVLRVGPRDLDASRFESLVHEAKAANARPDRAAVLYRRALEQWRGPAFAGLAADGPLAAEAHRLEELRLEALEGRIAADLDAGRHGELIPELAALTSEQPMRERPWGQLMIALYRSGRQADASAAYHRARAVFAEELGMDPSGELQSLHDRILRNDPALEAPHERLRGYELVEEIGEGGFGVVYRAWQPQLAREVAIKAIRPALANDPEFIRRFEAEAQVVARLEHANTVPLYDYWREPGAAYLVLRWIRGGSLEEASRLSPFDLEAVARLEEQIASALSFAHRLGVVHSDLKPANVLLDEEGNAYLSDFGIAADLRGLRAEERDLRLSPAYLSPEQIRGEPATPATDIYCLGLLLYQVLSGVHPFSGTPPVALLQRQLHEPLPPVTARRPELPGAIDDVIARATAKDAAARFPDVVAFDLAFREALLSDPTKIALGAAVEPANPYKGLRPFDEADALDFFGRDALVDRLVARLGESVEGHRFLGVVGPSGSGKSSAVRAGLVPALRAGAIPGSETWFIIEMIPGTHPFAELERALLQIATDPPSTLIDQFQGDRGLADAVERVLPADDSELILLIDQLEELFTHVDDEETRAQFLACLEAAATDPRSRLRVIATLRADYFHRPLAYPGFGPLLGSRTETVTPLTPAELELAISGPAHRVGVAVEPELLVEIVADSIGRVGTLPLLQYALTELFERREDGALTLSRYREVDGVGGALSGRADELYDATGDAGKETTRQLFLRLVNVDEGIEDLRRRVLGSELESLEGDREAMVEAIDAFTRHRLLTSDRDPVTREPTVEVAHEAFLRSWPRLRGWIDSAREDLRNHRLLATEVAQWADAGRDPSFLLRGSRLERSEAWAAGSGLALNSAEREYLEASLQQREAERAAEEAQRRRERFLERRSMRRLRALVAVLVAAALVAASLTLVATSQRSRAERESLIATARELAAAAVANLEVDPERSILLAMEAIGETRSVDGSVLPEAEEALHQALAASRIELSVPGMGGRVDWSPKGVFVTEGPEDSGVIDIRDAETGESVLAFHGHDGDVTDVAFSPDGSRLATTGSDGMLKVWDPSTGDLVASASGKGEVWGPSFSSDGSAVAAAWLLEGSVRVLNPATAEVDRTISVAGANGTALSPDGRRVAVLSGADGYIHQFEVASGEEVLRLYSDQFGEPSNVSWSPDGRYVAGGALPRVWDATTGKLRFSMFGHTDVLFDVDWSRDSSRLVTGAYDGTAKVWALEEGGARELMSLSAQPSRVITGVAFSPDGTRVMTGNGDVSAAKIWDVSPNGDAEWANLPSSPWGDVVFMPVGHRVLASGPTDSVNLWDPEAPGGGRLIGSFGRRCCAIRIDVSSDGATIAMGYVDGRLSLRDAATGDELVAARADPEFPNFDLSPNGEFLAIALSGSNTVRILDRSGRVVRYLLEEGGYTSTAPEFSPDGRLLATVTRRGADVEANFRVRIWDWERGEVVTSIQAGVDGQPIFDTAGALIATPWNRRIEIWDVASGDPVVKLPYQPGDVYGLAFSPDGSLFATGAADGTVRLFDAESGQQRLILRGPAGQVRVAFSADGSMLASRSNDGTVRIWALDIDDLLEIARRNVTRSLTDAECRQYLRMDQCPPP